MRRQAQLLKKNPSFQVVNFRGNVQTRLRKLDEEIVDGEHKNCFVFCFVFFNISGVYAGIFPSCKCSTIHSWLRLPERSSRVHEVDINKPVAPCNGARVQDLLAYRFVGLYLQSLVGLALSPYQSLTSTRRAASPPGRPPVPVFRGIYLSVSLPCLVRCQFTLSPSKLHLRFR